MGELDPGHPPLVAAEGRPLTPRAGVDERNVGGLFWIDDRQAASRRVEVDRDTVVAVLLPPQSTAIRHGVRRERVGDVDATAVVAQDTPLKKFSPSIGTRSTTGRPGASRSQTITWLLSIFPSVSDTMRAVAMLAAR